MDLVKNSEWAWFMSALKDAYAADELARQPANLTAEDVAEIQAYADQVDEYR